MSDELENKNTEDYRTDKSGKKPRITLKQKIDLFRRYLDDESTPNRIIATTVYEGYPIGTYLVNIRFRLNHEEGLKDLTQEDINQLRNMGLLEKKHESTTVEKIDRLIAFCSAYPYLWFFSEQGEQIEKYLGSIQNDEEKSKIIQQLEQVKKDYAYIRDRKSKGKISEKDIQRLKEAGVGGVFGYKGKFEKIAEGCQDKKKAESLKKFLQYVDVVYGSIEEFKKHYISQLIENGVVDDIPEDLLEFFVTDFDISSPNLMGNGYAKLYKKIARVKGCVIVDSKKIDETMNTILKEKERVTLQLCYGLKDGKTRTTREIEEEYHIDRKTVAFRKRDALHRMIQNNEEEYGRQYGMAIYQNDCEDSIWKFNRILESRIKEFVTKFFEYHDIFVDSQSIDEDARLELIEIINKGIQEKSRIENALGRLKYVSDDIKVTMIKNTFGSQIFVENLRFLSQSDKQLLANNQLTVVNVDDLFNGHKSYSQAIIEAIFIELLCDKKNLEIIEQELKKVKDKIMMDTFIEESNLPKRACNILRRAGINTVGDIIMISEGEFKKIKSLGPVLSNVIVTEIHNIGFQMSWENEAETFDESIQEHTSQQRKMYYRDNILEMIIEDLGINMRAYNCLKRSGINTVGDLVKKSEEELKGIRSLGQKCYDDIIRAIEELGLHLQWQESNTQDPQTYEAPDEKAELDAELDIAIQRVKSATKELSSKKSKREYLKLALKNGLIKKAERNKYKSSQSPEI